MEVPCDGYVIFCLCGFMRTDGGSVTLLLRRLHAAALSLKLLLPQPMQLSNLRGGSQQRSFGT
jgi:hypothetical protein